MSIEKVERYEKVVSIILGLSILAIPVGVLIIVRGDDKLGLQILVSGLIMIIPTCCFMGIIP